MPIKVREGGAWVEVSSGGSGGFVTGMIMMFSGTTAPTGWVLCNNSTEAQAANAPDLRDRFIVGAGNNYAVDATGGSADAVVVQHNHSYSNFSNPGNHTHTYRIRSIRSGSDDGGTAFGDDSLTGNINSGANGGHTHSFNIDNRGVSGTNKNLPPYYALAFIMKT